MSPVAIACCASATVEPTRRTRRNDGGVDVERAPTPAPTRRRRSPRALASAALSRTVATRPVERAIRGFAGDGLDRRLGGRRRVILTLRAIAKKPRVLREGFGASALFIPSAASSPGKIEHALRDSSISNCASRPGRSAAEAKARFGSHARAVRSRSARERLPEPIEASMANAYGLRHRRRARAIRQCSSSRRGKKRWRTSSCAARRAFTAQNLLERRSARFIESDCGVRG